MNKNVLIVGTGLGGLSTGLRLAKRGYHVEFVEKNNQAGGRLNQLKKDGFTFDIGPSFFSMPYEFEELMKDCNTDMPFEFVELDPLYTVNFRGSDRKFSLYKDIDKLSEQFVDIEPDFKNKFKAYLKKCEQLYNDTVDIAIKQNFDSIPAYVKALMGVNPVHLPVLLKNFWKQVNCYFESKEARQIISLIAFFLGRTPFDTNAIYTLLSHIEFSHTGYYNVKGGMYAIVTGLVKELEKSGAVFHYNTEITDYTANNGKLTGLTDQNGKKWEADIFVINADAALFRGIVFKRKKYSPAKLAKMDWTMGYLTFYVGLDTKIEQIEHHNYFLGNNYEEYAKDVMKNPGTLEKPYYYVNAVSKSNPDCAPEGCESLFFVCPVPNLQFKKEWSDKEEIIRSIIDDFSDRIKQDISKHIISLSAYTPEEWQNRFNLYSGAGLGLSHAMLQIGAFRPKNYDEEFFNTFYVGASTIPGAGLPMAVISSKLVVERICRYQFN
ncbi:phytoene desaturase [Porphyromonadaceae bacterium COT-184 OH4590]|nr:phytoene desaturase [Porphyromonadaceae bacterium COT-184 OH4590]